MKENDIKKNDSTKKVVRKKYLPIGTVVLLKGAKKRVMITGFAVVGNSDKNKVWDYCGYLYPEGNIKTDLVCLFDHKQIQKICYLGYENEEEIAFKKSFEKYMKKNV